MKTETSKPGALNATCTYCGKTYNRWKYPGRPTHLLCTDCRFALPKPDRTYWNTPEARTA